MFLLCVHYETSWKHNHHVYFDMFFQFEIVLINSNENFIQLTIVLKIIENELIFDNFLLFSIFE